MKSTNPARLAACKKVRDIEKQKFLQHKSLVRTLSMGGGSDALVRMVERKVLALVKIGTPTALEMAQELTKAIATNNGIKPHYRAHYSEIPQKRSFSLLALLRKLLPT